MKKSEDRNSKSQITVLVGVNMNGQRLLELKKVCEDVIFKYIF